MLSGSQSPVLLLFFYPWIYQSVYLFVFKRQRRSSAVLRRAAQRFAGVFLFFSTRNRKMITSFNDFKAFLTTKQ